MSSSRIAKNTKIAFIDRIGLKVHQEGLFSTENLRSFRLGTKIRMIKIHNVKLHFILAPFSESFKNSKHIGSLFVLCLQLKVRM